MTRPPGRGRGPGQTAQHGLGVAAYARWSGDGPAASVGWVVGMVRGRDMKGPAFIQGNHLW